MPNKDLLDHHIEQTTAGFENVNKKLDRLTAVMWILVGISIGLSPMGSKLFEIAAAVAGGK